MPVAAVIVHLTLRLQNPWKECGHLNRIDRDGQRLRRGPPVLILHHVNRMHGLRRNYMRLSRLQHGHGAIHYDGHGAVLRVQHLKTAMPVISRFVIALMGYDQRRKLRR